MIINSSRLNFAEVVEDLLYQYGDEVAGALTEIVPQVAKEAAAKLRKSGPSRSGKYRRSWTSKVEKKRIEVGATVYAKAPGYQRAHLLEYGHAKRNGGRVRPIEHIKPVEEWAILEAENRIIEKLERQMR